MFSRLTLFRRTWLQFSLRGMLLAMLVVGVALTIYRWPWHVAKLETPFQTGLLTTELGFDDGDLGISGTEFGWEPPADIGRWSFHWRYPKGYFPPIPPPWPHRPPDVRAITTYRRGWNGLPMKDGREEFRRPDGTLMAVRLWVAGEPCQTEWIQPDGEVIRLESCQNGAAHGKFFSHEDTRRLSGVYRAGKKTGVWQHQYRAYGELISVDETYDADLPHGAWTWRSASGQILQTAAFDQGKLTTWNGQPWREELQAWVKRNQVDPITRKVFEAPFSRVTVFDLPYQGQAAFVKVEGWTFSPDPVSKMLLYVPKGRAGDGFSFYNLNELDHRSAELLLAEMLPLALRGSRTLVYRFGVIGVVPICDREVNWRDPTGVSRIRFAAGSAQQVAWEEAVPNTVPEGIDTDWWFQQLFHGVPIQIDGRELDPGPDANTCFTSVTDPKTGESEFGPCDLSLPYLESNRRRSRRDILGLLLLTRGFTCQQRGNVLILRE